MAIEPRDEYDNLCVFTAADNPTVGYNVAISQASLRLDFCTQFDKAMILLSI